MGYYNFIHIKKFLKMASLRDGIFTIDEHYPRRCIRIYDGRREADLILEMDHNPENHIIAGKFCLDNFNDFKVCIIRVTKDGCADFDNPLSIPIEIDIESEKFSDLCNRIYCSYAVIAKNIFVTMARIGAKL